MNDLIIKFRAISAAIQAEHPTPGLRLAMSAGLDAEDDSQLAAAARYNHAHRHVKRAARRVTMAARKRRGRR